MKIAIICDPQNLSSKLTQFFTGCPAYHIGFVDDEHNLFYDMNLLFRRRNWPHYPANIVELYECPVNVTHEDLEWWLTNDADVYGFVDYFLFCARDLFKTLGWTPRNHKGSICSEKINQILISKGWVSPWPINSPPPSPCDFRRYLQRSK